MTSSHGKHIWYELMTNDPDGAADFYAGVMGWTARDSGQAEMDYRILFTGDDGIGGLMPISAEMAAGGAKPVWLGYVCVDDVDRSVANIEAAGGKSMMPAMDVEGVGRMAMVADPQGALFYVMTPTGEGESTSFSVDRVGRCGWNELVTDDQAAALTFYSGQFGWSQSGAMDMGPMGAYSFLNHGDIPIGAMMNRAPGGPPSRWNCVFRVADIDVAAGSIRTGGGQILNGPHEVPGADHVIYGIDPQGASFVIVGKKAWPVDDFERIAHGGFSPVSVGTELVVVQKGIPEVIPLHACYLGRQESLANLARLVEPDMDDTALEESAE